MYSPTKAHRDAFAQEMKEGFDLQVNSVDSVNEAIKEADVIVTATSSAVPALEEEMVKPGTHIIAMGSKTEIYSCPKKVKNYC